MHHHAGDDNATRLSYKDRKDANDGKDLRNHKQLQFHDEEQHETDTTHPGLHRDTRCRIEPSTAHEQIHAPHLLDDGKDAQAVEHPSQRQAPVTRTRLHRPGEDTPEQRSPETKTMMVISLRAWSESVTMTMLPLSLFFPPFLF